MIKVLIDLENKEFREKLAYRLSEISSGLKIDLKKDEDAYDIEIGDDYDGAILPVSKLYEHILDSYTERTGSLLYRPETELKNVIQFISRQGGSGLSSIAFSFARVICGRTGQRTLYVDTGPKDRFLYGEYTDTAEGSVKELNYLLREKRLGDPRRYLSRDHFGPFVICTEKTDSEMVQRIAEYGGFTQIVISGSEKEDAILGNMTNILVVNKGDVRVAELDAVPDGYDYVVRNMDYANNAIGNIISIAKDEISFKMIDSVVRISMAGEFGIGVEKLVRMVEEDEKGIFWNMS